MVGTEESAGGDSIDFRGRFATDEDGSSRSVSESRLCLFDIRSMRFRDGLVESKQISRDATRFYCVEIISPLLSFPRTVQDGCENDLKERILITAGKKNDREERIEDDE